MWIFLKKKRGTLTEAINETFSTETCTLEIQQLASDNIFVSNPQDDLRIKFCHILLCLSEKKNTLNIAMNLSLFRWEHTAPVNVEARSWLVESLCVLRAFCMFRPWMRDQSASSASSFRLFRIKSYTTLYPLPPFPLWVFYIPWSIVHTVSVSLGVTATIS